MGGGGGTDRRGGEEGEGEEGERGEKRAGHRQTDRREERRRGKRGEEKDSGVGGGGGGVPHEAGMLQPVQAPTARSGSLQDWRPATGRARSPHPRYLVGVLHPVAVGD